MASPHLSRRSALSLAAAAAAAPFLPGLAPAPARAAASWRLERDPAIAEAAPELAAFLSAEMADMEAGAQHSADDAIAVRETARAVTPRLVSVLRRIERVRGARAGVWFEALTWDRQGQDFLLLDAMVTPDGAGHRAVREIATRLKQDLLGRGVAKELVAMATPPDPISLQNFTVEPSRRSGRAGGLAFHWGPHELQTRTPLSVIVPQELFRAGLKPEFRDQFEGAPAP